MHILLIEDNPGDRKLVAEMIRECGDSTITLQSVALLADGVRLLRDADFDLVLLDMNLPDSTGLHGLGTISAAHPQVPVVIFTDTNNESIGIQAMQEHAADYLVKGQVNANQLLRCFRYAIERKNREILLLNTNAELDDIKINLEHMVDLKTQQLVTARLELERSRRMADIGRLASTIAHELRSPLAAMRIAAHIIGEIPDTPALSVLVEVITKKIAESDAIIENLLMFTRIRASHFEPVAVAGILSDCIASVRIKYSSQPSTVQQNISLAAGDTIEADPTQMRIVFNNLLDNAFQALRNGKGVVTVAAAIKGDRCEILISDTGSGIAEQDMKKIFEPFFTTKAKGNGLGLALCHEMVVAHRGTIDLRSRHGEGTTFTITLPVRQPSEQGIESIGGRSGTIRENDIAEHRQ